MVTTTQLTENGRTTIPKKFREKYGLAPGDELVWQEGKEGILVRKKQASARGVLVPDDTSDGEREAVAQVFEERIEEIRKRNQPPVEDDR